MKIIMQLTIAEIEAANFILERGIEDAKANPDFKKFFNINDAYLDQAETFRKKLLEQYVGQNFENEKRLQP